MDLLIFAKWKKLTTNFFLNDVINIYFKFSKKLMLELFVFLMLELLELF